MSSPKKLDARPTESMQVDTRERRNKSSAEHSVQEVDIPHLPQGPIITELPPVNELGDPNQVVAQSCSPDCMIVEFPPEEEMGDIFMKMDISRPSSRRKVTLPNGLTIEELLPNEEQEK